MPTDDCMQDGTSALPGEYLAGLQEMIDAAEKQAFNAWFQGEQGKEYYGMYSFAKAAWQARAALAPKCRGVMHPGCNYSAACGTVCTKCGQMV